MSSLQVKFSSHFYRSISKEMDQEYTVMLWVNILWMTHLRSCTMIAIDKREAFLADKLDLILSAMGYKWQELDSPLKVGMLMYFKGKGPFKEIWRVANGGWCQYTCKKYHWSQRTSRLFLEGMTNWGYQILWRCPIEGMKSSLSFLFNTYND